MKFVKDFIYLVQVDNKHWYVVRQTGLKSWIALNVSHLNVDSDRVYLRSNGVNLWKQMNPTSHRRFVNVPSEQKLYREALFNVLKYGNPNGSQD